MLEANAFLAAFTLQAVAMSVLHPAWFIRRVRVQTTRYPPERFAQFYPNVDLGLARERFLTRYRALNTGIAVLGLLLLGWLFSYMRRPSWDPDRVVVLLAVYFAVQLTPICVVAWRGARFKRKVIKHSLPEGKRKATLQPRRLFDFVSAFTVLLAVVAYFLFAGFVIYVQERPFKGFALVGILTLVYALEAFVVYTMLYGKKINALETNADSVRAIGVGVKACVYGCILCVVFFALAFTLDLLNLHRWMPFALSAALVICTLLCFMGFTAPPRQPGADGSDSEGRLTPGTRDLAA
jgi:hypothetical protein